jgi:phosphate:Na+ symporter
MSASFILLQLAGYVALLLWGMHMVHTGIVRAFGASLRHWRPAGKLSLQALG